MSFIRKVLIFRLSFLQNLKNFCRCPIESVDFSWKNCLITIIFFSDVATEDFAEDLAEHKNESETDELDSLINHDEEVSSMLICHTKHEVTDPEVPYAKTVMLIFHT